MMDVAELLRALVACPAAVTPRECRARRVGPRVFANSMPKAGTHLLLRVLSLVPEIAPRWRRHVDEHTPNVAMRLCRIRRGQVLTGHLYCTAARVTALRESVDVRVIFLTRDLRDMAVSNAFYITHIARRHRLRAHFRALPTDGDRLMASIRGIPAAALSDGIASRSMGDHARDYLPWSTADGCLTVRFEDLVGAAGGGDDGRQRAAVRAVLQHLEVADDEGRVQSIADRAFSSRSHTFRRGQVGDWVHHFDARHREVFKEVAGDALVRLGYETGCDW